MHVTDVAMVTMHVTDVAMVTIQVFYEQFRFFINLYFLVVALTQFIPQLRIGYLYTYFAPLVRYICRSHDLGSAGS